MTTSENGAPAPPPASVATHALPEEPAITIIAYGIPGPQGSKDAAGYRTGKDGTRYTRLVESSAKVKPWRKDVENEARRTVAALPYRRRLRFPLTGALEVEMQLSLQPPKRIPADRYFEGVARPVCWPDLSKILRSSEDALTTAGVWADDALVVRYRDLGKHYAGQAGALDRPGALIRVYQIRGPQ